MPIHDTNDYLSQTLIETIFHDGEALSAELENVKTLTSKELVEEHMQKLERFLNVIEKMDAAHAQEIDRLRNTRRMLKVLSSTLKTDSSEAKSLFWKLHREEKDSKFRSPSEQ